MDITLDSTTWLIIGAVIAVILLVAVLIRQNRKKSPRAVAEITQNGIRIKVTYNQPYKKDRTIFGDVVPYDKVWRTGANAATLLDVAQDVRINGNRLPKGRYTLYTIPTPTDWTIIINGRTGQWGLSYKEAADVMRFSTSTRPYSPPAEQFFISFEPQPNGTNMLLTWDDVQVVIPIQKAA